MRGQRQQAMKWVFIAFVILILNSGYLAAFAEPTLFYLLNVLLHIVLGVALIIPFFIFVRRFLAQDAPRGSELAVYMGRLGYWSMSPCMLTGLYLVVANATQAHQWILYFHIAAGFIGAAFFQKSIRSVAYQVSVKNSYDVAGRVAWVVFVIALLMPLAAGIYHWLLPREAGRISNPDPLANDFNASARSPFAPSAVSTPAKKIIPAQPFLLASSCGRSGCHPEIVQQWQSSAHRYSSFNNPWYRKSVEALLEKKSPADTNQARAANHRAKWCAGCHSPALLVSGKILQPLPELIAAPEAPLDGGISCVACHSIVQVRSTAGQADYAIEETPLHEWAASENKIVQRVYDFLLRADPEPHRRSMIKPFHRDDGAKFCSACHKAHLDQPVNQWRWLRSFNDYDPWQAGPFSSGRSRGYVTTREGKNCVDCHMPLVALKDGGKVRSHLFLGANTALPTVNQDREQLEATTAFLRDHQVSVEIFALGKPGNVLLAEDARHDSLNAKLELQPATLFAIGDEQSFPFGAQPATASAAEVIAPLAAQKATVKRGEEVRLDVVVRSLRVGHFFPGGKVEMSEAWLELQAFDNRGQVIFWSGAISDEGVVDLSAHFYRSYWADSAGKHLDKNNWWAARAAAYVNLVPPGGADVARYRLKIPAECGNEIHVVAKLNYRKFNRALTNWVFAETAPREMPAVEMAHHAITLTVIAPEAETPAPKHETATSVEQSWSDYGLALLAQNDFKNAEAAFLRIAQNRTEPVGRSTRAEPVESGTRAELVESGTRAELVESGTRAELVEAMINVGIVRARAGNWTGAREALEAAMKTPNFPFRAHFYYGVTLRAQGEYDEALKHLKKVVGKFPRDRIAKIERGRLYLLMHDDERARLDFEKVLSLDPENVEAYYYLRQVYRKLGEEEKARRAEKLYERFKAEALEIAFDPAAPEAQNIQRERRFYHEHVSMPFGNRLTAPADAGKNLAGQRQ